jgi:chromosome segregation protein
VFLKSLSLKGFKSFADATTLDLEPGVTVVVGPNGSGKSNVVDAIAWVLGAQAPRAVRAAKMEDIIFAGTEKRPALGRAEVSLTIDNASKLLPIDFEEVTLTRTLWRSGDSDYAINGVSCRLLDFQELLSDSGVGRQQHVIVSQGQIDAVLNARPEERRLIIEEAAGILKFRKRKEKAERRLLATEANLTRVQDLLREVRRQLRPLERQADAARRHGSLVDELGGLQIFAAGRDIAQLKGRTDKHRTSKIELQRRESELVKTLTQLDLQVMEAEAQLGDSGDAGLATALTRFESLRERAKGVAAVLAERLGGLQRGRDATIDTDVVSSLEAEAARIATELAQVTEQANNLVPDAQRLETAEAELAEERERFSNEWGDGSQPVTSGAAAEVRGELTAVLQSLERANSENERLMGRKTQLVARGPETESKLARFVAECGELVERQDVVEASLLEAVDARSAASDQLDNARRQLADAERERDSWTTRSDALALALDEARSNSGLSSIESIDGVMGTLLDLVEVDDGWSEAFEAAAGDAVTAVVVADRDVGRQAIDALLVGDASGVVLALADAGPAQSPISGGESVRAHVRGTVVGLDVVLDALVGSTVAVDDWAVAVDLALDNPGVTVVTRDGGRFSPTGWRVGSPKTGATGAALEESVQKAETAIAAVDRAREVVVTAEAAMSATRSAANDAEREKAQIIRGLTTATSEQGNAERHQREAAIELEGIDRHIAETGDRLERDRSRSAQLQQILPSLEADDMDQAERGRQLTLFRSRLQQRADAVGTLRRDLEVRAAGIDERTALLQSRQTEVESRLVRFEHERANSAIRRVDIDRRLVLARTLADELADNRTTIESELQTLRAAHRRQSDSARSAAQSLDQLRRERSASERALQETRAELQKVEIGGAEATLRLEAAVESLRRDHDKSPQQAMNSICPELDENTTVPGRTRELERELRLMGPINPLALQEYETLSERHDFLKTQLDDVRSSRREMNKVIRAVDEEIVNVFSAAYADVSENFTKLFTTLFPGGKGSIRLTDPSNLLEAGVEISARPGGKNIKKLSLLSGGERSLTALAFLFAVFRSRPSPFYVMDEVEAALDDVNLHRFLGLVDEFRGEAQLMIVSHQKRTMEAADCLYGVSMKPGGSSKVLSERAAVEATIA